MDEGIRAEEVKNQGEIMKKIIDLTYLIEEGMLTFDAPWHPVVSITQMGRHDVEGRETRKITFGTHTGTQVDAPLHFVKGGNSIDKVSLEKLVGEVTIIDFSELGKMENSAVTAEMLEKLKIGKRVIFKFGWSKHWNTKKFYVGYPYFTKEAAEILVARGVEMVGLDPASPDDSRIKLSGEIIGTEEDSPIHKIFLRNGIALVEYLNLENVTEYEGWTIAALPLKIKGADGSTARAILFK